MKKWIRILAVLIVAVAALGIGGVAILVAVDTGKIRDLLSEQVQKATGRALVINGDLSQVDLPHGVRSGLRDAMEILAGVKGVAFVTFSDADVVRHPLVGSIVRAYGKAEELRKSGARYESLGGGGRPPEPDDED